MASVGPFGDYKERGVRLRQEVAGFPACCRACTSGAGDADDVAQVQGLTAKDTAGILGISQRLQRSHQGQAYAVAGAAARLEYWR